MTSPRRRVAEVHIKACKNTERCREAQLRSLEALDHLQRAHNELGEAMERLAGLCGASQEWEDVDELCDQVKALWHRVKESRDLYTLDDISEVRR